MVDDYSIAGVRGFYWVSFDEDQDGQVLARALGPVPAEGGPVGAIASARGATVADAERLLMDKLRDLGA